jgi:hypothetical protein
MGPLQCHQILCWKTPIVDFHLYKSQTYLQNLDVQSHNVTHLDNLLISTVTTSSHYCIQFCSVCITCTFITVSLAFKSIPYIKLATLAIQFI